MIYVLRYRKNKISEKVGVWLKKCPLSALARSANMFYLLRILSPTINKYCWFLSTYHQNPIQIQQDCRHRTNTFRLMAILLWFMGSPGIALADSSSEKTQGQENSSFLYASPYITSTRSPDSPHTGSSEKYPEKQYPTIHLPRTKPLVSIIIDDLGYRFAEGVEAINLPGPVTFSIIPHTPYARKLSDLAHKLDKEILLHIPMEPQADHYLEPGGLTTRMTRAELIESIRSSITSLPHARGLSNHMGSLLTRQVKPMRWVMEAILEHGKNLYFVDSRTTADTVALTTAKQYGIPTLQRDVFLDHESNVDAILIQLHQMIRIAKTKGSALGLAHPRPETLHALNHALPELEDRDVTLVPVSMLLKEQMRKRQKFASGMVKNKLDSDSTLPTTSTQSIQ
uniref:Uncharacterized conserved protein YibQ, putative polysaccharide deacetylase 2 family n=1 Tax=Candidatus Kentrum sp. TUN TaxID=2126343 RepID=A0A450ZAE5_9GAMM|nr:MAG: Uncharacterized conserved protein YibQ, putative polysaccharide deacetylase 2 family [Candidatus Kentron sp. TUN]VFK52015.1 MAG: Uncharacterized conserved protein YibQ, putative polysaccharide deacetylase 2 family [Candidatus Kentron sp. TUN]